MSNKIRNRWLSIGKDYLFAWLSLSSSGVVSVAYAWYVSFIAHIKTLPLIDVVALFALGAISGGLLVLSCVLFRDKHREKDPFYKALTYIQGARPRACNCFYLIATHDSALFSSDLDIEDDLAALLKLGLIEGSSRIKKGYKVYCVTPLGKLVFEDEKETILEQSKVWEKINESYNDIDDPRFGDPNW